MRTGNGSSDVVGSIAPAPAGPDLRIAMAAKEGHVIMAMKPAVTWIAFDPDEARDMGAKFLRYAAECGR